MMADLGGWSADLMLHQVKPPQIDPLTATMKSLGHLPTILVDPNKKAWTL